MELSRIAGPLVGKLCRLLAPGGRHGRHQVLIFHRVLAHPDPLLGGDLDQAAFRGVVEYLSRHFAVLPLSEAVTRLRQGELPRNSVSITFDDGYRDNYELALPVLRQAGVPATIFVASAFLNGGRMWNDTVIETVRRLPDGPVDLAPLGLGRQAVGSVQERVSLVGKILPAIKYQPIERREELAALVGSLAPALPDDLMMSSDQVRALPGQGIEVGGHTRTHPILARLDAEAARAEIQGGKADLERILGQPVRLFAYPNGKFGTDFGAEHVQMVRDAGFEAAVSTDWGVCSRDSNPWRLPRFTPWANSPEKFALGMLRNRFGLL